MDLKTTILLFALVCALAAVFVLWAKWEEEKVKTGEERDRRWDEISRALGLEKEAHYYESKCDFEEVYHKYVVENEIAERVCAEQERDALQDKLSALLCPTANHVWKDGVCVKCGRMHDA